MYFQQDGAQAHTEGVLAAILNELYPERWIGTNVPNFWPARSPDLTTIVFYLGTCNKMLFMTTTLNNLYKNRSNESPTPLQQ